MKEKLLGLLLGSALSVNAGAVTSGSGAYTVTDLGTLAGASYATGINDAGQIVGYYEVTSESTTKAFLYQGGAMTDLGALGGTYSQAHAISNTGYITGWGQVVSGQAHAFRYFNGSMLDLGTIGGDTSEAYGVNSGGTVAGMSWTTGDVRYHAISYAGGQLQDLGSLGIGFHSFSWGYDVNDAEHAVGYTELNTGEVLPFIYHGSQMQAIQIPSIPGVTRQGRAVAINNSDQMVGDVFTGARHEAVMFDHATMITLGSLASGLTTYSSDINDFGAVVGTGNIDPDHVHAFVWSAGVIQDLNSLTQGSGWELLRANSINNLGQIVGWGLNPQGQPRAFLATPVPEPASAVLATLCGALGFRRCRRTAR